MPKKRNNPPGDQKESRQAKNIVKASDDNGFVGKASGGRRGGGEDEREGRRRLRRAHCENTGRNIMLEAAVVGRCTERLLQETLSVNSGPAPPVQTSRI